MYYDVLINSRDKDTLKDKWIRYSQLTTFSLVKSISRRAINSPYSFVYVRKIGSDCSTPWKAIFRESDYFSNLHCQSPEINYLLEEQFETLGRQNDK